MKGSVGAIVGLCLDAFKIPKFYTLSPSHQIFGHMHEALNIDKK
jgi:hypothetical protein